MLLNESRKEIIINETRNADSFWKKLKGLMFEGRGNFNYALIFELPEESKLMASIHMLFVFFPIDIVYLDKNKSIVEIKKGLKPFSLNYTPEQKAKYFIELPGGKAANVKVGDKLLWD